MALPPSFLEELRSRISLAEVVSRRVRLQKRGREYVGLCPFHKEKTPSFTVVEEKAFFHCFGCGAHGDVVGFTMRMGNLGFREAVESLAREAGLAVPVETQRERDRYQKAQTLYDVCEAACRVFERQLREPVGAVGLEYLRRRGVRDDTINAFRLGYAAPSRSTIHRVLGNDYPQALLLEAGLLRKSEESGDVYDFFRDRVIFPIADRRGRVIAFGGRVLDDQQPKYLNSPDTPIFNKGRMLFGAHLAREACAAGEQPIAVEGYMDVIALHGHGFASGVAPLGTALTDQQLIELWQLGSKPVLCFDGDAAGQRAARRALQRALPLLRPESTCAFARLPPGEDPDSYVRGYGAVGFRRALDAALPLYEFLWESEIEVGGYGSLDNPESISRLEATLRKWVTTIDNRIIQRNYNRFIGDRLWDRLHAVRRAQQKRAAQGTRRLNFPEETGRPIAENRQKQTLELVMSAIAINHPEVVRPDLEKFVYVDPANKELRDLWTAISQELSQAGNHIEDLRDRLAARGQARAIEKVLSSKFCKLHSFCRFGAEKERASTGWKVIFARYQIPRLKRDQDEALSRWNQEPTEENWHTVDVYRQIIAQYITEEEHIEAQLAMPTTAATPLGRGGTA